MTAQMRTCLVERTRLLRARAQAIADRLHETHTGHFTTDHGEKIRIGDNVDWEKWVAYGVRRIRRWQQDYVVCHCADCEGKEYI